MSGPPLLEGHLAAADRSTTQSPRRGVLHPSAGRRPEPPVGRGGPRVAGARLAVDHQAVVGLPHAAAVEVALVREVLRLVAEQLPHAPDVPGAVADAARALGVLDAPLGVADPLAEPGRVAEPGARAARHVALAPVRVLVPARVVADRLLVVVGIDPDDVDQVAPRVAAADVDPGMPDVVPLQQ